MDIKDLPEVTSLEDEDYFVIQSGDLTGKILKSNLEFSTLMSPQIITSINPPENSEVGAIWNEINSNNELVETWHLFFVEGNLEWVSDIKCSCVSQPFPVSLPLFARREYQLDLATEHEIFIDKFTLSSQIPNAISSDKSVSYTLQRVTGTTTSAFIASNISIILISDIGANKMFKSVNAIKTKYSDLNLSNFRVLVELAPNTSTNIIFNATVFYRHIY